MPTNEPKTINPRVLGPPIENHDQARNWVVALVKEVSEIRAACDLAILKRQQRKEYLRWLIKRGEAVGVLQALQRTGWLSDIGYMELMQTIVGTGVPTMRVWDEQR